MTGDLDRTDLDRPPAMSDRGFDFVQSLEAARAEP